MLEVQYTEYSMRKMKTKITNEIVFFSKILFTVPLKNASAKQQKKDAY